MATAIHHGDPGSYKSFVLCERFLLDALCEGRTVVTNIRGIIDINEIRALFPEKTIPESAHIIRTNGDSAEGRALIAGFFHWVPFGSVILIDEGQRVYPDRPDFKLTSLDKYICPPGYVPEVISITLADGSTVTRPESVFTAFDMQRHFNWDIYISTPNVKKIKPDIREVAEYAYLHKSLSGKLPGFLATFTKHKWLEFQHDPENTGKLKSNQNGTPRTYKADTRAFKIYQSTVTGNHTQSKAGQSVFGDPTVKLKLFFLFVVLMALPALYFFHYRKSSDNDISAAKASQSDKANISTASPVDNKDTKQAIPDDSGNVPSIKNDTITSPADDVKLVSIATQTLGDKLKTKLAFYSFNDNVVTLVKFKQIFNDGIRIASETLCSITLITPSGKVIKLSCQSPQIKCSASLESVNLVAYHGCKSTTEPQKTKQGQPDLIPDNSVVGVIASK